ncbi:MAG: hypothetical protein QM750_14460 [Rubrivivax sp.]
MGREAVVVATVDRQAERLRALLESTELILRGTALKRRWPLAVLQDLRVQGDGLHFSAGGEAVALALGAEQARKWLDKIRAGPPSLAAKLGVSAAQPAAVFGPVMDDAELRAALQGAVAADPQAAALLLALVHDADELAAALALHARMPAPVMWIVNVKGRGSPLGENAIRATLRAAGYVDNKTAAVSARLAATRYRRR